ncbi:LapA family protein [Companilactobacillus metriopterae]|uniref:LapA family protein n=1 Tax=Companilactobacillus metriopterae TaxID=1909267 RepID=UPI00100A2D30|nr:lipopolysaccharide assembly protein LapA domain-containing protein [Companilactobacillus metriopterae]
MKEKNNNQVKFIIGLIITLIVVIFAVLNVEPVTISFGFTHIKLPLIVLIIVTLLLGSVITVLLASMGKSSRKDVTFNKGAKKQLSEVKMADDNQIANALKNNQSNANNKETK